jgi:hypothetical protein
MDPSHNTGPNFLRDLPEFTNREFWGYRYYDFPGQGNPSAQEEMRYNSILNTAWDPALGRFEWGWHDLETNLRLAMMNPDCASLVGGTAAALELLANTGFGTADAMLAEFGPLIPAPTLGSIGGLKSPEQLLGDMFNRINDGKIYAGEFTEIETGISTIVVGPAFQNLPMSQQMTVFIHELVDIAYPGKINHAQIQQFSEEIASKCGTLVPPDFPTSQ